MVDVRDAAFFLDVVFFGEVKKEDVIFLRNDAIGESVLVSFVVVVDFFGVFLLEGDLDRVLFCAREDSLMDLITKRLHSLFNVCLLFRTKLEIFFNSSFKMCSK